MFTRNFSKDEWNQISPGQSIWFDVSQRSKEAFDSSTEPKPTDCQRRSPKPEPLNRMLFERLRKFTDNGKFQRIAKRMIAAKLPDKDIKGLLDAFKAADADGNGVLTAEELRVVVHSHICKAPDKSAMELDEEFANLMNTLDVDGDGEIGYEEFIAGTMELKHWQRLSEWKKYSICWTRTIVKVWNSKRSKLHLAVMMMLLRWTY